MSGKLMAAIWITGIAFTSGYLHNEESPMPWYVFLSVVFFWPYMIAFGAGVLCSYATSQ